MDVLFELSPLFFLLLLSVAMLTRRCDFQYQDDTALDAEEDVLKHPRHGENFNHKDAA